MNEENADSVVETEVTETTETDSFDMDGAVDQMGADLFGKEPEEKTEEAEETEDDPAKDESDEAEVKEESEPEPAKMERPDSWKKDMQETWDNMTKEAQEYVVQREEQMKAGLEIDRTDSNLGRTIRDTLSPYSQLLKNSGVDEVTAVRQLMHNHMQLASAPPEQKKALFEQWAKGYGVEFGESQANSDETPEIKALKDELSQIKGILNNNQQALQARAEQERQKIAGEIVNTVDAFAKEHPYFDELSGEIAKLISADYELEDAYNVAFRSSDYYAEQLRQEAAKAALEEAKTQAEKVKQAQSVNIKNRDTGKKHTAPLGSMDDTLNETYRELMSRN